jgi:hypothetical protein
LVRTLLDQGHVLHRAATEWLAREQENGIPSDGPFTSCLLIVIPALLREALSLPDQLQ